ncbi:ComF family protein [Nitrosomonas sp.]|uniref:ComF family protein n=1 Tax=Nitrosomonas sp. TaxID=42353 RepID=UPI001DEA1AD8|nr:ComF family protein [Nitrosomonas sp.]MCB1949978.1 ComF family protein [Nitrosomonas sp.]
MKQLIYKNCLLCDTLSYRDFCDACFKDITKLSTHYCMVCAKTIASGKDGYCGDCLASLPAYSETIAALTYTFPTDRLIHALKYRAQLAIAPILAQLLFNKILQKGLTEYPDLIIPMPLHPKRLQERGFNQALEIGRHVARQVKIELSPDGCKRIKNTPPQTELPWKMRKNNVKNVFSCDLDLSGKHLAVIDDVMTTGATLNELAQQLCKQGAKKVTNWVVARVQRDRLQARLY